MRRNSFSLPTFALNGQLGFWTAFQTIPHTQTAHLQFAQADTQTPNCKKAVFAPHFTKNKYPTPFPVTNSEFTP